MTQNAKNPFWIKALLVIGLLIAFAGFWLYLSGAVFLVMIKKSMNDAQLMTWYQYYHYYNHVPLVHKKLMTAAGIVFIGLLIPVALILKPSRRKLHGDARFAKAQEVKQYGLMNSVGLIVGKMGNTFLMYAGAMHAILCAPTRSGKGISTVIPNCLNWAQSLVVLDIKQEAYDFTSGYRARYGQQVYLLNFSPKDYCTHRWNPLHYISDDPNFRINDIQKIASFLFPDIDGQDPIWTASSRSLFLGTVLYLIESDLPVTLGEVLRTVTQPEEAGKFFSRVIGERQEAGNPLSVACVGALSDFIATSENTRTSIRKTFSSRFELLYNPLIDAATSGNDFDLRELRKKKMSIYVGITPDDLDRMQPLLNLFFQQLIDLNTQELPQKNPEYKYRALLLLDEFTAAGKIPALSKGVSYVAGYGLCLMPIIQSYSQLRDVYGDDAAETFSVNLGLQIDFAPKDQDRADEISKMLGTQTWRVKSWGKSSGGKGSRSENQSDQRRELMLPQEVKAIGPRKQFIFGENMLPIFCDKIHYFEEPAFVDRLKEVSPSLGALGDKLPNKDQLERAAGSGELRAPVPKITVVHAVATNFVVPVVPESATKTTTIERAIEPADIDKLDDLTASDFSCDFSDIEIPDPASDDELQAGVDELLARFGYETAATPA